MLSQYRTKQEVHNHALEAVNKPMIVLNKGEHLRGKSGPGDAFEKWFDKPKDSDSEPDMREAGVDLKATPYKTLKNGKCSAKERLVLNIINYEELAKENFEDSHFLHKNKAIELAFYEHHNVDEVPKDDWTFSDMVLFEMQKNLEDFEIIKKDWETIQNYVLEGKADQINEGISQYLAACTKGKNAKSLRKQPFSEIKAKQRAFSLKSGYMTHLLREYIRGDKKSESIFQDPFELSNGDLKGAVLKKLDKWKGKTINELEAMYKVNVKKGKNVNYMLVSRMLGLSQNVSDSETIKNVEEFEKANIIPKTILLDDNGRNKESMSFKAFKSEDIVKQQWNDEDGNPSADWHLFLLETTFLFVVFQKKGEDVVFQGAKFFRIPEQDIEGDIKYVWEDTVAKIKNGVELTAKENTSKPGTYRISTNFIKRSDDKICHVRPHASKSDYSGKSNSSDKLPTKIKWINRPSNYDLYSNDWMTKQCFWLNNNYINDSIKDLL